MSTARWYLGFDDWWTGEFKFEISNNTMLCSKQITPLSGGFWRQIRQSRKNRLRGGGSLECEQATATTISAIEEIVWMHIIPKKWMQLIYSCVGKETKSNLHVNDFGAHWKMLHHQNKNVSRKQHWKFNKQMVKTWKWKQKKDVQKLFEWGDE